MDCKGRRACLSGEASWGSPGVARRPDGAAQTRLSQLSSTGYRELRGIPSFFEPPETTGPKAPVYWIAGSRRPPVAELLERGGYGWVVFDFGLDDRAPLLQPRRHWAVHAYGEADDTRSRPRGAVDWSNILNYRFNFQVTGLVNP